MALIEFRFPDEGAPATSFLPTDNPTPDFGKDGSIPAVVHRMRNGTTRYVYYLGSVGFDFVYRFEGLTDAKLAEFEAFFAAAKGATFRVKNPISGSWETLSFGDDLSYHVGPYGPTTWTLDLPLKRAA